MRERALSATARRVLLRIALLAALPLQQVTAETADSGAASSQSYSSVQDLRYGVVLYDFFQDNYFQALTELLLGEQKQDMPHHAEFAQLLRGGISLSYGMDRQAQTIFDALLAQHPKAEVRDRAWFYLGKNLYERGDNTNALDMLQRSGAQLPARMIDERAYLRANIALQSDDLEGADMSRITSIALPPSAAEQTPKKGIVGWLKKGTDWLLQKEETDVEGFDSWSPYLLFNRGALFARRGDWQAAANDFTNAANQPARDAEHKALRDRALVAAGYAYLGADQAQAALTTFRQVRLNGPFADKALLGYGWAAAQAQDYPLALQPWQTLNERSLLLPAVQESLLAVPYAYEKLNASAQALQEYERAEQLFNQEIIRIDAAQTQLQNVSLLSLWLDPNSADEWISRHQELPVTPQLPYLEHLLALNPIQDAIKDMRDLAMLDRYLADWQGRLSALDTAQALQYQRRQKILQDRPDKRATDTYRQLQQQRSAVAEQLQQAERNADGHGLQNAAEIAANKRLKRVRQRIDKLRGSGQDVTAAEESYRRYRGLLLWQTQDNHAARRWELTKQLRDVDRQLAEAAQQKTRVDNLVERARQPEQGERIRALDKRLQSSLSAIHRAQQQGEKVLRERARAELQIQRERLVTYLARTRLAKARLYDKGTTEALP
jgi:outer membrane protein assembly factor BamD (BamD/ComL family)